MICRLALLILLCLSVPASAGGIPGHHGGGGGSTGILLPLTGGSLGTPNSGTLTFPGSSGWYGFDVYSNAAPMNMQAIAICTATNGVCVKSGARTFFKFKSQLETPTWQSTYCLVDSLAQSGSNSDGPSGANITDRLGNVFAWAGGSSPNYNINKNGTLFATADRMVKADDGMMYFTQSVSGNAHWYWWTATPETPAGYAYQGLVSPFTIAAGTLMAVSACPSGL